MSGHLCTVPEVEASIRLGDRLLLAGEARALEQLPRGAWIGGTIPYFMTKQGGVVDQERIFVDELPAGLACRGIRRYGPDAIGRVYADLPRDGFGVIVIPASSAVHLAFALGAPSFQDFAVRPLVGWVSGIHLEGAGCRTPLAFDGGTGKASSDEAVVMHVGLPPGKVAELGVLNIFTGGSGPAITFPSTGFSAKEAEIDGERRDFAAYIQKSGLDLRLPLVADYCGTPINVSYRGVDDATGEVHFYAPVFAGVPYRQAAAVSDYVGEFTARFPRELEERIAFSCNCIQNYLYTNLKGKRITGVSCPLTFGEIAYQLLNQTMVYVSIEAASAA